MVKKPTAAGDAEADERRRLRSLAFSNGLLQRGEPAVPRPALAPSSTVARLQGRDIVRRGGQCKSRFVFSFPGLLAPAAAAASGGRVGELADLGSKNPVLYLELPQMKSPEVKKESQSEDIKPADPSVHSLYSKEPLVQATLSSLFKKEEEKKRYTRSPKRSPATKGPAAMKQRASPKETQPAGKSKVSGTRKKQKPKVDEDEIEQLSSSSQHGAAADCDFKGGVGSTCDEPIGGHRPGKGITEPLSPKFESDGHTSEDSDHMDENGTQTTSEAPSVRQSARTVGKKALNLMLC